ncbi:DUF397 domain-containing protein [Streptomyces jumonjinensis]|uniref:DUF397 domain-containing protein n=1 Tax=Streptomyces jumonjinensis TaxID=1945 RepID=UPI0037878DEE
MTEEARQAKLATLQALLEHDLSNAKWEKSLFSSGGSGDCLEVTHVPEVGGWIMRHSILTGHLIPLTDAEYKKYCLAVQAKQPGLVPGGA